MKTFTWPLRIGAAFFLMMAGAPLLADTLILRDGLNGYTGQTGSYIRSGTGSANTNFNTTPAPTSYLLGSIASGDAARDLFSFDLSSIPTGATITSISLTLGVAGSSNFMSGPVTIDLYSLTTQFDPATVTWNQASTGVSWLGGSGGVSLGSVSANVGVTSLAFNSAALVQAAQAALNAGTNFQVLTQFDVEGAMKNYLQMASGIQGVTTERPTLTITYDAAPEPGTIALLLIGAGWLGLRLRRARIRELFSRG